MDLLADLEARGLIAQCTDRGALAARLAEGPLTAYCGFDPTADSLHVGHLMGQMTLRRFQLAGHRPIALAGGATGMVGDPSGRSEERNLLDAATLAANVEAIRGQLERLLDFDAGALLVNNADWTAGVGVLEFLRDVGKHVTVNHMVAKESVRARMQSEDGISFTEFSYMLLQANDFVWLREHEGCELQVGGSDQWGNITLGIDMIRRRLGLGAFGLTWPLLTKADGEKFGKTASGAVWLSAEKTSPYQFRQFWVQTPDDQVERLLLQFTLLPVEEIGALVAEHREAPERRAAQRRLAWEVTSLVHGQGAAQAAEEAAEVLFGRDGSLEALPDEVIDVLARELGRTDVAAGEPLERAAVAAGLAASLSEARRSASQGGLYVNRVAQPDPAVAVGELPPLAGGHLLLRRGRSSHALVRVVRA